MSWFARIRQHLTPHIKAGDWTMATPAAWPINAWQLGATEPGAGGDASRFGPVYACWSIIAQEISRVPLVHRRTAPDCTRETITDKAPARVLRNPNRYQTRSDFLLYIARSLLSDGNAYAIARRNSRFEIDSLHPVPPAACWPHVDPTTGDVYYRVNASSSHPGAIDGGLWYPARDILHIRLFTPNDPLVGETPLVAAAGPIVAGAQINNQMRAFFSNMARPSGIIRHPRRLDEPTIRRLKETFMAAATGGRAGEPVVFTEGMDWTALTMNAVDAQLVESFRLTERQIAQIYRVPQFLLGEDAKFNTVEQLTKFFINSGLGFYFDHISDSLTKLFALPANEEIHFDYEAALLRADFETRMRALEHATRSGVYSPNEARAREGLGPVEHGNEPRVQQQLVPLSYGMTLDATPDPDPDTQPVEPEPPPAEPEPPPVEPDEAPATQSADLDQGHTMDCLAFSKRRIQLGYGAAA